MSMNKKINDLKYVFLLVMIIAFIMQFIYMLSSQLTMTLMQKVVLFGIQILSIIGFTHFHLLGQDENKRKRGIQFAHYVVFIIYCVNLLYVLFLDHDFGRYMFEQTISYEEYLKYNVNIDPCETIMLFIHGYQIGVVSLETLSRNLIGNIVVFMPMAYFLPVLFKKQRHFFIFFITIVFIVLNVEILQVFLRIGSGDIDDLLLNVTGALVMFGILKGFHLYDLIERN